MIFTMGIFFYQFNVWDGKFDDLNAHDDSHIFVITLKTYSTVSFGTDNQKLETYHNTTKFFFKLKEKDETLSKYAQNF